MELSTEDLTESRVQLERVVLHGQRIAAYAVIVFCIIVIVIQIFFIASLFRPSLPDERSLWLYLVPLIIFALLVQEVVYVRSINRYIQGHANAPRYQTYLTAFGEGLVPMVGVCLFARATDWNTAFNSPPTAGVFLVTMLSILRLNYRVCIMIGAESALIFLSMIIYVIYSSDPAIRTDAEDVPIHLSKVVLFFAAGIVAAFVAYRMRLLVVQVIQAHNEKTSINRKLVAAEDAHRQAESIIWRKDRLFSILSHDLRTPINGVVGLSEFMARAPDQFTTEEIRGYAREVYRTSQHLRELLDNLVLWAQLRTDEMAVSPQRYLIAELIEPVHILFAPAISAKEIRCEIEIAGDFSIVVDRKVLQTILRNVLSNAVKFTKRGGTISIRAINLENGDAMVAIRDSGIGLSDEIRAQLLTSTVEPCSSTSGTEGEQGCGVGLLLCREFVRKLKGKLEFESEKGIGSEFRIILPKVDETHA